MGLPDERFGQKIVAVISTVENKEISEASLINNARDRLAGYKLPKTVIFGGASNTEALP